MRLQEADEGTIATGREEDRDPRARVALGDLGAVAQPKSAQATPQKPHT